MLVSGDPHGHQRPQYPTKGLRGSAVRLNTSQSHSSLLDTMDQARTGHTHEAGAWPSPLRQGLSPMFQGEPHPTPPWPLDQHGLPSACPTGASLWLGLGTCSAMETAGWDRGVCDSQGHNSNSQLQKQRLTISEPAGCVYDPGTTTHTHTHTHVRDRCDMVIKSRPPLSPPFLNPTAQRVTELTPFQSSPGPQDHQGRAQSHEVRATGPTDQTHPACSLGSLSTLP